MNEQQAFDLFKSLISTAEKELFAFTKSQKLDIEAKADKSLVTKCDEHIDKILCELVQKQKYEVVSEEGQHVEEIVRSGNYVTIDPIDGTLGYLDYVNFHLRNNSILEFGKNDLGQEHDFSLLLGFVINNKPMFGAVFNYITKETILISAYSQNIKIENQKRIYNHDTVFYKDQRMGGVLEQEVEKLADVSSIIQATFGLKSVYTFSQQHKNAVTIHRVQSAGLWDVLPAAVAASYSDGIIVDDNGDDLKLNEYIIIPGKGASVIKGDKFRFIKSRLKEVPNDIV